jgi:hypothetical protein
MNEPSISVNAVHPVLLPVDQLAKDCEFSTSRTRGPGGQHRNKTESAVALTHRPTGVCGQASERRSQAENRRVAMMRLRENLALEVRSPELALLAPTPLWTSRVTQRRLFISSDHEDYPRLLAEALDVVCDRGGNLHSSADQLGISVSQLDKFLRRDPRSWNLVNRWRQQHGRSILS